MAQDYLSYVFGASPACTLRHAHRHACVRPLAISSLPGIGASLADSNVTEPVEVKLLRRHRILQVTAGEYMSACLTSVGNVYIFGQDIRGAGSLTTPTLVHRTSRRPIVRIVRCYVPAVSTVAADTRGVVGGVRAQAAGGATLAMVQSTKPKVAVSSETLPMDMAMLCPLPGVAAPPYTDVTLRAADGGE